MFCLQFVKMSDNKKQKSDKMDHKDHGSDEEFPRDKSLPKDQQLSEKIQQDRREVEDTFNKCWDNSGVRGGSRLGCE
ncbi:unnamed protein product [Caenorhabditis brenneri]